MYVCITMQKLVSDIHRCTAQMEGWLWCALVVLGFVVAFDLFALISADQMTLMYF